MAPPFCGMPWTHGSSGGGVSKQGLAGGLVKDVGENNVTLTQLEEGGVASAGSLCFLLYSPLGLELWVWSCSRGSSTWGDRAVTPYSGQ